MAHALTRRFNPNGFGTLTKDVVCHGTNLPACPLQDLFTLQRQPFLYFQNVLVLTRKSYFVVIVVSNDR